MIPVKHSSIFKSRWIALLWAAGIIWFALDTAGPDPAGNETAVTDATGAPVSDQQVKDLEKAIEGI